MAAAAGVLLLAIYGTAGGNPVPAAAPLLADASDAGLVEQGSHIYAKRCASCHGRQLQGQPLWQLEDQFSGRRAPAHDDNGHTWKHPDQDLFMKTKSGRFPGEPIERVSGMPAYAAILDDQQILAVLAYIKARWPLGMRIAQAMLNPDFAGMPPGVDRADWRLPPSCQSFRRH